jgi:hypothetical protein
MQPMNCRTGKRFRPPVSVAPQKQMQPKPSAALSAREKIPPGDGAVGQAGSLTYGVGNRV